MDVLTHFLSKNVYNGVLRVKWFKSYITKCIQNLNVCIALKALEYLYKWSMRVIHKVLSSNFHDCTVYTLSP